MLECLIDNLFVIPIL